MPATLCVYALVPAGGSGARAASPRLPIAGLAGERLRLHRAGSIAAVVGRHTRRAAIGEQSLRRYDQVMQALSERFPAVMPVRFATYMGGEAELDFVLDTRQASLRRALAQLRGRAQMNVRLQAAPSSRAAQAGTAGSGREYLRRRAAGQRAPELDPVRPSIARWIRDERVERRGNIVSVYHLIPRRSAAAYRRALERAAEARRVRLLVTGPFVPYAFAAW